jgi:hypothetical protein
MRVHWAAQFRFSRAFLGRKSELSKPYNTLEATMRRLLTYALLGITGFTALAVTPEMSQAQTPVPVQVAPYPPYPPTVVAAPTYVVPAPVVAPPAVVITPSINVGWYWNGVRWINRGGYRYHYYHYRR